jgi:hypothetical protein
MKQRGENMAEKSVTISLPPNLYQRLEDVAQASSRPFEEVLLQSIRNGMPPALQKVPDRFHRPLLRLNRLSDQELWQVARGELVLEEPDDEAVNVDFTTLCRAYTLSLLKWRGHPIPDPTEFLF